MMVETKRAIARTMAEILVKKFGKDVDTSTVNKFLSNEIAGLEGDLREEVKKFTLAYIETCSVFLSLNDDRVADNGSALTMAEVTEAFRLKNPDILPC